MGIKLFGLYIGREPVPQRVEVPVEKRVEVFKDRVVFGTPAPVTVYRATCPQYESDFSSYYSRHAYSTVVLGVNKPAPVKPLWDGDYFATCEAAFAAHPGAKVISISGWRIGDQFVTGLHAFPITIQGKPKIAKGRVK